MLGFLKVTETFKVGLCVTLREYMQFQARGGMFSLRTVVIGIKLTIKRENVIVHVNY